MQKTAFKESKTKVSPSPTFGPCLCPAPVACVVRIAGILIAQLPPATRIPGDPGKHTLLRVMGRLLSQGCQSPTMMFSFSQHPLLPLPAPNPGLILELLNNNKASSGVRQDHYKAEFFLFGNYLISECDSQICKTRVCVEPHRFP